MIKARSILLPLLLFALALPIAARAYEIKSGNAVNIGPDETVDGTLYAAGSNISIDGTVKGDVFCAGQSITVSGRVLGDVFCAGQTITITGEIDGDARLAGNALSFDGRVARNAMAFGNTVAVGSNGDIGRDLLVAGAFLNTVGDIGRDLYGAAPQVTIAGRVGRDVKLRIDDNTAGQGEIRIASGTNIGGVLHYTANDEANVDEGAAVGGEITKKTPTAKPGQKPSFFGGYALGGLFSVFAALVVGLVLVSLWRDQLMVLTDRMLKKTGGSIGWGIVVMFIAPILAIILIFTLIGIPLAMILTAIWLIALYLSKVIAGIAVGRRLLGRYWADKKESLIWAMIIGIVITWIVYAIPFFGWLLSLLAVWWGLGGIWLQFRKTS